MQSSWIMNYCSVSCFDNSKTRIQKFMFSPTMPNGRVDRWIRVRNVWHQFHSWKTLLRKNLSRWHTSPLPPQNNTWTAVLYLICGRREGCVGSAGDLYALNSKPTPLKLYLGQTAVMRLNTVDKGVFFVGIEGLSNNPPLTWVGRCCGHWIVESRVGWFGCSQRDLLVCWWLLNSGYQGGVKSIKLLRPPLLSPWWESNQMCQYFPRISMCTFFMVGCV